jgi:hypothetical protein
MADARRARWPTLFTGGTSRRDQLGAGLREPFAELSARGRHARSATAARAARTPGIFVDFWISPALYVTGC